MKKIISVLFVLIIVFCFSSISFALSVPASAQFAHFTQECDNVYSAILNKYADTKVKHAIAGEYRTDEQIYLEIATGKDCGEYATMPDGIQNISTDITFQSYSSNSFTLPLVRESNKAWYVTKDGRVFNANGYIYGNKTYFSGSIYTLGKLESSDDAQLERAKIIYEAIKDDDNYFVSALAIDKIEVQYNGEYIDFTDAQGNTVNPLIINNRTMVPFRKTFNSFGITDNNIFWNEEAKIVTAKKDNIEIQLQINNNIATKIVSGEKTEIQLDSAPVIVAGRTLVPVRFIAESMNMQVGWDEFNRTVVIINTQEFIDDIQKSLPKLAQILNYDIKNPETYSMKSNISGSYKADSELGKISIVLDGTINIKQSTNIASADAKGTLTFKTQTSDGKKDSSSSDIDFDIIITENKLYIKSPLLGTDAKDKWYVKEDDSIKEVFESLNKNEKSLDGLFNLAGENIEIDSYDRIKEIVDVLKKLFKDENIKITEKGDERTIEITIDLKSITEDYGIKIDSGSLKFTSKIKDEIVQSNNFVLKIKADGASLELKEDGALNNENVSIKVPSDSETINMDEMYY